MIHHHEFWWRFFPKKELTQIYVCAALRTLALSLIALFIPLYLYKEIGLSLAQVFYFYIFYAVIFAAASPMAAKFAAKFGVKHTILASVPFYLAFVLMLHLLKVYPVPIWIISALGAFSVSFYWIGMHLTFYYHSDKKHRGEEVGKRDSVSIFAGTLGPLVGGLLIKFVGFGAVFGVAAIVLFIGASVLFLSKEDHIKYNFSLRSLVDKRHWRNALFFVSRGARVMAIGLLWPLYIFFIIPDYVTLGFFGSLLGVGTVLIVLFMGKYSDGQNKHRVIAWAASFEALSWFFRAFVSTVSHIFAATIFGAITFGVLRSPMGALEYDKAKEAPVSYFVSREVYICLGRILMLVFVLMVDNMQHGFIFNGFLTFAAWLF
jgi:MFS family permease